ncbi:MULTISPECIES: NAD-dependent succinate-semialdehyde dehydrogenase [Phyllobacteriaceae]|uniref:Succinic semialdehyde dehydrogenase n=1 Tax=Mesorhizobium japonicum (strain LMG 29417 / CECT 9101 / MAFF 303099) TaxID=266835 RepID=Q98AY0_RHILO|nr:MULTISPECIES: NAD-dependent succinate-semialdehyde dehydrogenase [Phyllobacteriaceae]BAV50052.1 succinate-semialdehyde dehydrogenase [Mesorhizobium loti]BAB52192.1 succinic semialdehyde dehydrogenase [Mesorhizobium japonicum MAFF 303099]BBD36130.1 NAD-dependent succinate-semialdehyde dehydrogenase [Aminobacter sp. SS-2016]BCG76317.1 putative succinate-semialdehyde dehydrogenase [NADP(+)] [Mesorhizobium sp. 113-1-2]BCG83060.1 putative succinate-semialdehyde dehydrogenase [NADP(+)] [Mesorhizo
MKGDDGLTVTQSLTRRLKNPELFDDLAGVPGRKAEQSTRRFSVFNPSTGELLAELPDMDVRDVSKAIDKAEAAQEHWAALTARERSDILWEWHQLILDHSEDLAAILTAEMGKPLAEAKSEIAHAAAYLQWYAEEANRIYGETISPPSNDRRMLVIKQPIGVVGAITPWNFPASMVARKISPALAAGCAIVLKPAEQTPLVAGAMFTLARMAGFPDGVLNLIYASEGDAVGRELCSNPKVRKISFTGSTEVGRLLMRECSDQIKRTSFELGGNAPFIVFDDADVDAAVDGALQAKFRNAGQTCVSANRLYVQSSVYNEFCDKFTKRVSALRVGDGFEPEVAIGPLIDKCALAKIEDHIRDAVRQGGKIRCGGNRIGESGTFFEPTVITDVERTMRVAQEETFGPLAPIIRFNDPDQVVREANDTIYGLAAYFYASNLKRVWRVAEALEYGMVGINTGRMSSEAAPFGGMKQSGIGREGSRHGLEDYLEMKYLCMGGL